MMNELTLMACLKCGQTTMTEVPSEGVLEGVICAGCAKKSPAEQAQARLRASTGELAEVIPLFGDKE